MYDFFIAHAGKDKDKAETLRRILSERHEVFLDAKTLQGGDTWNEVLADSLKNSKVILFLLSKNSHNAYYLHEEIARAIQHYRTDKKWYKIVPIYLDGFPNDISDVPYGLYQLHSLDLNQEKTYENICQKVIGYLAEIPSSKEDAVKIKDSLAFKHPLHEFPVGPMVEGHLVPITLIQAFADFVEDTYSLQAIYEANAFRKEADPYESGSILIRKSKLPNPNKNNADEFWLAAFAQARLHGPRMLAALLLTVQDTFFPKEAIDEKYRLLDVLRNFQ